MECGLHTNKHIQYPDDEHLKREYKEEQLFGFVNVYKPSGITSHDVVSVLRRITKIKQIGHTGTLDPFAEGVLPVCIGKATRLIEFLNNDKEYIATVQFGKSTVTYDLEGDVSEVFNKTVTEDEIKQALNLFKGEIYQKPPIYSAIKKNGKKLYEYARKGETVDVEPRKVIIEKIELYKFDEKLQQAEILIKCSKGTYIRSIANDLGHVLKSGAYLIKLIRTKSGQFLINDSVVLKELDNIEKVKNVLINPVSVLEMNKIEINSSEYEKVSHGISIKNKLQKSDEYVILIYNNNIKAVGITQGNEIRIKKVF